MDRPIMYKKIKSIIWKELLIAFIIIYLIQMFSTLIFAKSFTEYLPADKDVKNAAEMTSLIKQSNSKTVMHYDYNFYVKRISGITEVYRSIEGAKLPSSLNPNNSFDNWVDTKQITKNKPYYVWYRKVGMYNGRYIDLKLKLNSFTLSPKVTDKAYVDFEDSLSVYSYGVSELDITYEFYIHDDNKVNNLQQI